MAGWYNSTTGLCGGECDATGCSREEESQAHYGTFEWQIGTRCVKRIIERKRSCDILNGNSRSPDFTLSDPLFLGQVAPTMAAKGLGWLWDLGLRGAGDQQRWRREQLLKNNYTDFVIDLPIVIAVIVAFQYFWGDLSWDRPYIQVITAYIVLCVARDLDCLPVHDYSINVFAIWNETGSCSVGVMTLLSSTL